MATEPAARTPSLRRDTQSALYRRALETLPGGTDSNFRAWGESTVYVDRGRGGMGAQRRKREHGASEACEPLCFE